MRTSGIWIARAAAAALVSALATGPVFADRPDGVGKGKSHKVKKDKRADSRARPSARGGHYFDDHKRAAVHEYYGKQFGAGRCPPGLAKKHNGCLPPGQAKKWRVGAPLPRDVIFHPVPDEIVVRIGIPPAGQRLVRVAGDLLLIAVGTGMVIDAIEDLGRL